MEQLGIQPVLLLAQIINFGIIVFVLNKVLYKPVMNMLDKRRADIKESMQRAEKMKEEEAKTKEKADKVLDNAKKEAKALLESAKKQAKDQEKEILTDAQEKAQKILEKAKAEAADTLKGVNKEVRSQAIDLTSEMVKHLLSHSLSAEDQKKLLAAGLKEMESMSKRTN
jgi:F-type H+-transporting ATPase subunit b